MATSSEEFPIEVDVRFVKSLLDSKDDFVLLDCRESDEREAVHIDGSRFLPMSELMARADELEPTRDKRIVVQCHHGGRSLQVAQWLRQRGFDKVQSMAGGIDAWSLEIDPALPRY